MSLFFRYGIQFFIIFFLLNLYPQASAEIKCAPPYNWPRAIDKLADLEIKTRRQLLAQEMDKFSKQVGHCYARQPVGEAETAWLNGKRISKLREINDAMTVKRFCKEVRENIIDEKLPNSRRNQSPYSQYANCGEGSLVGACLAYDYGYNPAEIRICRSTHDHAWALIPEEGKKDSYCLLDRWNSLRCNVIMKGKEKDKSWKGNVVVPGKTQFKFSDATCTTLSQKFNGR